MKRNLRTAALFALATFFAYAFRTGPAKVNGMRQYGVTFYDATYYYVWEDVGGKLQGIDYLCISMESEICTVYSYLDPDAYNRIPVSQCWTYLSNSLYMPIGY